MNAEFYSFTQLAIDRIKEGLLFAAAKEGNLHDCESLLEIGADIDWMSSSGDTSLTIACRKGFQDIVSLLLSYGANVNKAAEADSLTALHIATMSLNIDIMKLVLSANPIMSIRTKDGLTAYDIARNKGFDEVFLKLVQESNHRVDGMDNQPRPISSKSKSNPLLNPLTPRAETAYLSPLNSNHSNRYSRLATGALSSGQALSSSRKDNLTSQSLIGDDTVTSYPSGAQSLRSSIESESYTIIGPDALQQHHDATFGLQKVYEKELRDRKAAELKVC